MTKDDLPPPPEPDTFVGINAAWFRTRLDKHARAAIAAHDAKREKVLLYRRLGRSGPTPWNVCRVTSGIDAGIDGFDEYRWAYIEREGA
jgi:hypothetical protein